jgi:hypothetical protein
VPVSFRCNARQSAAVGPVGVGLPVLGVRRIGVGVGAEDEELQAGMADDAAAPPRMASA